MLTLPSPDEQALKHSERLTAHIRQEIEKSQGMITFERYMELALYAPGLGYYSAGAHKLGKKGDFVTAPEISPLFAGCIANQAEEIFRKTGLKQVLEFGGGTGVFAKDFLLALEKKALLPEKYFILEISADLRERQEQLIQSTCPHLLSRIFWLEKLPENFEGIIFANEVMDAFPVSLFELSEKITERGVVWKNGKFSWEKLTPSGDVFDYANFLKNEFSLPENYVSEMNFRIKPWIGSLAHSLKKGVILLLDYGYGRREYYHPDRAQGTLMCFYQHHFFDDPFLFPGLQDHKEEDPVLQYQQSQAIKTLTLPSQMGELIKVIALNKNIDLNWQGFSLQDRRRDL